MHDQAPPTYVCDQISINCALCAPLITLDGNDLLNAGSDADLYDLTRSKSGIKYIENAGGASDTLESDVILLASTIKLKSLYSFIIGGHLVIRTTDNTKLSIVIQNKIKFRI